MIAVKKVDYSYDCIIQHSEYSVRDECEGPHVLEAGVQYVQQEVRSGVSILRCRAATVYERDSHPVLQRILHRR